MHEIYSNTTSAALQIEITILGVVVIHEERELGVYNEHTDIPVSVSVMNFAFNHFWFIQLQQHVHAFPCILTCLAPCMPFAKSTRGSVAFADGVRGAMHASCLTIPSPCMSLIFFLLFSILCAVRAFLFRGYSHMHKATTCKSQRRTFIDLFRLWYLVRHLENPHFLPC